MKKHSDLGGEELRDKIIGLGEKSFRKSYYPALQGKLADLERFMTLLDQSNDAIFLTDVPSGSLIYASKSACRQIGYPEEECHSLTMYDIAPLNAGELHKFFSGTADSTIFNTQLRKRGGELTSYELNMHKVMFKNREYAIAIARDITEREQAEEALRESEEKFKALAESLTAVIFVYQGDRYIWVNKASERITGYKSEELLKQRIIDVIHPDFKEMILERALARQRGEPVPTQYETKIVTKSGEVKSVLFSVGLMMYRGKLAGVATMLDITERKQAEEALRKSEMELNAVIQGSPIPQFVIDKSHRVIRWNKALEKFSGIRAKDILYTNQQCTAFYKVKRPCLADLLVDGAIDMIPQWFAGKYAKSRLVENAYEATDFFPLLGESGKWMFFTASLIKDPRGNVMGAVETLEDITERRQAEVALRESERKFRQLADSSPIPILLYDAEEKFRYLNPKFISTFGYTLGDLPNLSAWWPLAYPDQAYRQEIIEKWTEHVEKAAIELREITPMEAIVTCKDRSRRTVEFYGNVIGRQKMVILQDVTERKRAEEDRKRLIHDLGERVKELRALYRTYELIQKGGPVPGTLQEIVTILPPAWQYPEVTAARISLNGQEYTTSNFSETQWAQRADFYTVDGRRGAIEIYYLEDMPEEADGPFLSEERSLLNSLAKMLKIYLDKKYADEALAEAKTQAELYLDLMGHDITNMNQALMGNIEMMDLLSETGEIDKGLIDSSLDIINRSSRMIRDVKKLTQVQAGKVPQKNVDICEVLSAVKSRYSEVPGRLVSINYAPGENCLVRAGDLLDDVFDNIVDNAIRHSRGPVTVDLTVEPAILKGQSYYRITVADTGPGIPNEQKRKIFMTLKESEEKAVRRGFGLYLVRTLVDYYHGKIWVEDRVPGDYTKGAKFVVMLPAVKN